MTHLAFIGLGSNLGDRLANLGDALRRVDALADTCVLAVSQAYESEPAGDDAAGQRDYANAVARLRTDAPAERLVAHLLRIEEEMGRPPAEERAAAGPASRVIDLDLLLFDTEASDGEADEDSPALVLPHPRMRGRAFVMRPLAEVGPDARWPDGAPVTAVQVDEATEGPIITALGPIPGWEELTVTPDAGAGTADTWVELALLSRLRPERKPDMDLLFVETVLTEAGIPCHWDPHPPTEGSNPWGVAPTIRLLVPSGYAERARRIVAEAESGSPEWPAEFGDVDGGDEGRPQ